MNALDVGRVAAAVPVADNEMLFGQMLSKIETTAQEMFAREGVFQRCAFSIRLWGARAVNEVVIFLSAIQARKKKRRSAFEHSAGNYGYSAKLSPCRAPSP